MHMNAVPIEARRGILLYLEWQADSESPWGAGPLQEQYILLAAGPSLQLPMLLFLRKLSYFLWGKMLPCFWLLDWRAFGIAGLAMCYLCDPMTRNPSVPWYRLAIVLPWDPQSLVTFYWMSGFLVRLTVCFADNRERIWVALSWSRIYSRMDFLSWRDSNLNTLG